jgi:predicted  nucleic acid-binding Zn-ribbon protein
MQDIIELERRITAAMDRIAKGLERGPGAGQSDEVARLTEALDEERMANAQLNERIKVLRDRDGQGAGAVQDETATLKAQLLAQKDEIATLRRVLAEAGKEIATLRAARSAEAEELAEIVAALDPVIAEANHA